VSIDVRGVLTSNGQQRQTLGNIFAQRLGHYTENCPFCWYNSSSQSVEQ
jgi:hypothetical protein